VFGTAGVNHQHKWKNGKALSAAFSSLAEFSSLADGMKHERFSAVDLSSADERQASHT